MNLKVEQLPSTKVSQGQDREECPYTPSIDAIFAVAMADAASPHPLAADTLMQRYQYEQSIITRFEACLLSAHEGLARADAGVVLCEEATALLSQCAALAITYDNLGSRVWAATEVSTQWRAPAAARASLADRLTPLDASVDDLSAPDESSSIDTDAVARQLRFLRVAVDHIFDGDLRASTASTRLPALQRSMADIYALLGTPPDAGRSPVGATRSTH